MSVTLTLTESPLMKDGYGTKSPENTNDKDGGDREGIEEDEDAREAELIVFDNTTQGLGLKICGGCSADGKDDFGVFVKRVLSGGLAETSGEVCDGDLILEVNGQSMQGITYDKAVSMLRQASASNHVELVITRDPEARREYEEYLARYGPIYSPQPPSEFGYGDHVTDSDIEFQRKMGAVLKDSDQEQYSQEDQRNVALSGKYHEMNGHVSPSSSCASEVANHLSDAPSPSQPARSQSNGSAMSRGKNTPSDYLDSLLSKKLSQDPGLKLHIDQLESAITNLGLQLTPSTQAAMRQNLTVDPHGMVRFEEFVEAAKTVFRDELGALKGRLTPQVPNDNVQRYQPVEDYASVVRERDALRAEIAALKEELRNQNQSSHSVEEQLLYIRKQAQASIEEGRSLRSKLHLAEQAQAKAQQTERDYEEVVAMLENEVAQLRLQMSKSDGVNMQKRLAVLVCQLKKAESGKKTCEVATEKLMRYVEHALEVLAGSETSQRPVGATAENGNAKKNKKQALATLANEGREVIKVVRSLMETVPLPFGWEEAYTAEGVKYYINHLNQTTTWTHPVSCMEHQTSAKTQPAGQRKQQQQQQQNQQQQQQPQAPAYQQIQPLSSSQPQQKQPSPPQPQAPARNSRQKIPQPDQVQSQIAQSQQQQPTKESKQRKTKNGPHSSSAAELRQAQAIS